MRKITDKRLGAGKNASLGTLTGQFNVINVKNAAKDAGAQFA
jgi:hypothetical protein